MPRNHPFLDRPVLVALVLLAVTVAVTWPLAPRMGASLPANLGDPLLNTWTLGWGAERLAGGLRGVWDAPIFYPHRETLAFSEHLLGVTVFVAPVYWLTDNAVLTYNAAYLLSFVHAGLAMWLLVRRLTGRSDAALLAALAFAFPLLRTSGQQSFLHMQVSGWGPLCFWAVHRYFDESRLRDALLVGVTFALAVLTSLYFLFVLVVPLLYMSVVLAVRAGQRPWRRWAAHAVAAGAVVAGLLGPVLVHYQHVASAFQLGRSVEENAKYSADVASYFSVWHQSDLRPFLPEEQTVVRALFPGVVIPGLALLGLIAAKRRDAALDRDTAAADAAATRDAWRAGVRRAQQAWQVWIPGLAAVVVAVVAGTGRFRAAAAAALATLTLRALLPLPVTTAALYGRLAALSLLLSLGPIPSVFGQAIASTGPYTWLLGWLPGAAGLRMPARLGMMVSLALAVLAGFGGAALLCRRWARPGLVLAAASVLLVLDGYSGPLTMVPFDPRGEAGDTSAHAWITERGPGPVLHLPVADVDFGRQEHANASVHLEYQYATLQHGQPIVSGGTDFKPLFHRWLAGEGSPFRQPVASAEALEMARRLGVRYLLVHTDEFETDEVSTRYERDLLAAGEHIAGWRDFGPSLGIELRAPLPSPDAQPVSTRGPPEKARCRYESTARPAASRESTPEFTAATWKCPGVSPGRRARAVRFTLDLQRPDTWPVRLRVEAKQADGHFAEVFDLNLLPGIASSLIARPTTSPQVVVPVDVGADEWRVHTEGARAPRSTPPFWLEVWSDAAEGTRE